MTAAGRDRVPGEALDSSHTGAIRMPEPAKQSW